MHYKPIWIGVACLIASVSCGADDDSPGRSTTAEVARLDKERMELERRLAVIKNRLRELKQPVAVTSFDLLWQYHHNATQANGRFLNRDVEILAELLYVDEKTKTVWLTVYQNQKEQVEPTPSGALLLYTAVASHSIVCKMESREAFQRASVIGSGQRLVVHGVCRGPMTSAKRRTIVIDNCRFEQPK